MRVLDIFSGIGGFSLGLERAGMQTIAFCEIDEFCRRVLRKHWPHVPIHEDVRELDGRAYRGTDVICGGFPCQDISEAGKGKGIEGDRSGLWSEFRRLIEEVEPAFAIIENTGALRTRGLERVIGDLSRIGYDTEWSLISACAVGAPHPRDRMFIVAHTSGGWGEQRGRIELEASRYQARNVHHWESEPEPPRVADGVPRRSHRNRALGNAVVPQIPEIIGRALMTL